MTTTPAYHCTIYIDEDNMTVRGNHNKIRSDGGSFYGIVIDGNHNHIHVDGCDIRGNHNYVYSNGCNVDGDHNCNEGSPNNFAKGNHNNGRWANRKNDLSRKQQKTESEADMIDRIQKEYEAKLAEERMKMLENQLRQEREDKMKRDLEEMNKKLKKEPSGNSISNGNKYNKLLDFEEVLQQQDRQKMSKNDKSNEEMLYELEKSDPEAFADLQTALDEQMKKVKEQRSALINMFYDDTIKSKEEERKRKAAGLLLKAEEHAKKEKAKRDTQENMQERMMEMIMNNMNQGQGGMPPQGGNQMAYPPQGYQGYPPQGWQQQQQPMYQTPPGSAPAPAQVPPAKEAPTTDTNASK